MKLEHDQLFPEFGLALITGMHMIYVYVSAVFGENQSILNLVTSLFVLKFQNLFGFSYIWEGGGEGGRKKERKKDRWCLLLN